MKKAVIDTSWKIKDGILKNKKLVSTTALFALLMGSSLPMTALANVAGNTTTDTGTRTTTFHTSDKPKVDIDGSVLLKAMNNAPNAGVPVGDIPLAGYKFRVSWYKGYHNSVEEAKATPATLTAVWQTNNQGSFSIANDAPIEGTWANENGVNVLPLGTLVIEEIESVPGVDVSGVASLSHIKLNQSGEAYVENVSGFSNKQPVSAVPGVPTATLTPFDQVEEWKGRISVVKLDKRFNTNKSRNQGDSELAGVQFQVINQSKASVWVDGVEKRPGDTVTVFDVVHEGDQFVAHSQKVLPYGTYLLKEYAPHDGYLLNTDYEYPFTIRTKDQHVQVEPGQLPENGTPVNEVIVGKMDSELNQYLHNGGSSELVNTVFNVVNASRNPVMYLGKEYAPGEVMGTINTRLNYPEPGKVAAQTAEPLPYGTYTLKEKTPPKGYLPNPDWGATVVVRQDGEVKSLTGIDEAIQNQVKRFNLEFQKIREEDNVPMANIAFKITDTVTGESHVVVTDENGRFDTELLDPLTDTNANDPTAPNTNGAVKVVDGEWKVVDESKLNNEAGVWFVGADPQVTEWTSATSYRVNGIDADPIDPSKGGPLQFATYSLEELRQPANEGRLLYKGTFRLDKKAMKPGYKLDLNNLENRPIGVYTDATTIVGKDGAKYNIAPAKPGQRIIDEVVLDNFVAGAKYTLDSKLHLLNKENKSERVLAEQSKTFTNKFQSTGSEQAMRTVFEDVDLTGLEGHKLVATQVVKDTDGEIIAEHNDLTNEAQMISIPEIGTSAMGDIDREENGAQKFITIPDTIKYKNLEAGKEYTATGTLMDKATGKPYLDKNGKEITATTTFVAEGNMLPDSRELPEGYVLTSGGGKAVSGEVVVEFTFEAPEDVAGKTLVAFEKVESDGMEWAVHADIEDESQTVTIPKVETTASDPVDGDNEVPAEEKTTVKDTVKLTNLVVGNTYDVTGTVHLKGEDGSDAGVVGEPVKKTVKATSEEMTVEIEAVVDLRELAGRDIVWFEELSRNGVQLGLHADITDEGQTLHIPKIGTKLATIEGAKEVQVGHTWEIDADGKTVKVTKVSPTELELIDTVEYSNLTAGKEYVLKGELHRKVVNTPEEGTESLDDVNEPDGTASTDDAEDTTTDNDDPSNAGIGYTTPAADNAESGEMRVERCESGGVISKSDDVRFTPEEKTGVVEVPFKVTIKGSKDLNLVAYERLVRPGKPLAGEGTDGSESSSANDGTATKDDEGQVVARHEDPCDPEQSINIIDIKTTLKGKTNDNKQVVKADKETLIDTVPYNNLTVGKTYELCGTLVDKETGEKLTNNEGKEIRNCKNFVPEKPTGSVDIEFEVYPKMLEGKTLVAFEELSRDNRKIAVHADINDVEQTVYISKIGTKLTDKKGNQVIDLTTLNDKKYVLTDTIAYENLIPGDTYKATGCLMNPATQKKHEGTECKTVEFVPEKEDGSVDVTFEIDTTKFKNGDSLVAFEEVLDKTGHLIGDHKDFTDKNQTVKFTKSPKPSTLAETGATVWMLLWVTVVVAGAGAVALWGSRRVGSDS